MTDKDLSMKLNENDSTLLTKGIPYENEYGYRRRLCNYGGKEQFRKNKNPIKNTLYHHSIMILGVFAPYSDKRKVIEIDNGKNKSLVSLEDITIRLDYLESKLGYYKLEPIRFDSRSHYGLAIVGLPIECWGVKDTGSLVMDIGRIESLFNNQETIVEELKKVGFCDLTKNDLNLYCKEMNIEPTTPIYKKIWNFLKT